MSESRMYDLTREIQNLYILECRKSSEMLSAERKLSAAYLRLRELIGPEAFDTPHAPSAEQVWETTERALKKLVEKANAQKA